MQNNQCIKYTSEDSRCIFFSVIPSFLDLIEQLLAVKMLQDQVDVVFGLEDLIQLQDIGMPDLPQEVDFIVESQNALQIIFEHRLVYCFERELPLFC